MRDLITGSRGFIGTYLYDYLKRMGHEVTGDCHHQPDFDVRDPETVERLVAEVEPDAIFHLAAQSFPARSFSEPRLTLETNLLGTLNVLEAARKRSPGPRVVFASSSAAYGGGIDPMLETHPLNPLSPYAVSKMAGEHLCRMYHVGNGVEAVIARIFNTIGPGKEGDAVSDFARRLLEGERPLRVGRLDTVRDFSDVRDVVRGLVLLAEKGEAGEAYNICSGKGVSLHLVVVELLALTGRDWNVVTDESLLRPADEDVIVGDNSRIKRLGWEPWITLERTLADVVDYWKEGRSLEGCGWYW